MSETNELKMWLVVRDDLEIPKGKLAGQSGHAFEGITRICLGTTGWNEIYRQYVEDNTPKIVVKCKNLAALERAEIECVGAGILTYKVTDAGRTVFPEPTITVLAIGPTHFENLPKFVQRFQLMKD